MTVGRDHFDLVDRELELAELRALLEAGEPRLALLTGRRRIGKTYLLSHAFPPDRAFLFTAARTSPELNRRQLLLDLERWSGEAIEPADYPTWRSVFNLLLDLQSPEKLAVIVDEFQYLADDHAGLSEVASELNAAWERRRPSRPILLVLAGSAVTTMEALASGGAPLYGRFHWHHRLRPFDYWHAGELAPFAGLRDRARAYGIFGGVPRYLAAADPSASLRDNVIRMLLAPYGEVRQLVETSLDQEDGLRDVPKYKAILRAVAAGQTRRNEIAQRSGLSNDTALRDKLDRLVGLDYLEERRNVDAKANEPIRYAVADPAIRFHQRFVEPNLSMLERANPAEVWDEVISDQLPLYMGHAFEPMATQGYERLRAAAELPLVQEWGRWEGADRDGRSLEIDLVAPLARGGVLTGAVKWNRDPVGVELHFAHLGMLHRAAHAGRKWAHDALEPESPLLYVAAGGFVAEFEEVASRSEHRVVCWDLADLYSTVE